MKKTLILLIGLIVFSCSIEDDSLISYQEAMAVESAILPNEIIINQDYEIKLSYLRPTSCHVFKDILHQKNNNIGEIYIIGTVFQGNGNCTELNTLMEASFNFKATQAGFYVFKFWNGKDANGEDTYLTIQVPVVE